MSDFKPFVRPAAFWALGLHRAEATGTPPPRGEPALVAVTALHLAFLPWAFGTVHLWSQELSAGLAAFGLALALLRPRDPQLPPQERPFKVLLRWPFFWAGLAMMAYVAVQGLNPAERYISSTTAWTMIPANPIRWLPSGAEAPFALSNPWRGLLILGSLWLLVCSVRAGFSRRQSFRLLFIALCFNAALLTALGIAEQLSETRRIFWTYLPSNNFVSSFIYRNHAGAYFDLMVALASGLTWWHYRKYRRLLENPSRTLLFAFIASFVALMVIFSASRTSIFLMACFAALSAAAFVVQLFRRDRERERRHDTTLVLVALACCLVIGVIAIRADAVWSRFAELANDPSAAMANRVTLRQAAGKMFRDRWLFGWGAGCFRYGFPIYAQHYPAIYDLPGGLRQFWEHAHDDLLEIPIEFGVAGLVPLLVALASGIPSLVRHRFWLNPVSYCLLVGCALTVAHAWLDFVFQCPAILLTWSVLLVGASRWAELDGSASRRRLTPQTGNIRAPAGASPA